MSTRNRVKVKSLLLGAAAAAGLAVSPYVIAAANGMVIEDIQVRGLNRVTLGAVLLALPVQQGDVLTDETTALAMKRLFATGNFDNVSLSREGNTLIVNVVERPTIGNLEFAGNKQIDEEMLRDVIERQGLRSGEALNVQSLGDIRRSLEDFYHSAGMYQAQVKTVLTYLPRNRVDVKLEFNEGVSAEIQQINIVGNNSFDEDVLLAQMELRDDVPWWNFMANQRYDTQKFTADLEALRSYYLDRGFVRFKVDDTSVEVTPDRKGIYLTIAVSEGDQYTIGESTIRGNTLKFGDDLKALIDLEPGEVYSASRVAATEKALQDYFGKFGYAYSNVRAFPVFDEDNKVVNLEFQVEPGSRIYVSQINITGNCSTDDTVIRRELRQMDGTWLSNEALEISKNRLNRLGYFETAEIDVQRAGATADTVNLNTSVKEQPTGSISGGIGYGTSSGLLIQAGVSQNNVFGWGTRASLGAFENDYRKHIEASYTDPYFTIDQISLGGRIYYDKFDGDDADVVNYDNRTIGFMLTAGYPLSETISISYSLGYENVKIDTTGERFLQSESFWKYYGDNGSRSGTFDDYIASITLSRNNLDRAIFPTSGSRQRATAYATLPGSDLQFYKLSADAGYYFSLDSEHDFVIGMRGRVAYGDGYGTKHGYKQRLPFFENFYLGGSEWLRGFSSNSIGPRALYTRTGTASDAWVSDDSVGGNAMWAATLELAVPTPFLPETYKGSVRSTIFLDAGALWDTEGDYSGQRSDLPDYSDPSDYRASIGVSLTWLSPIGPLSFSLAKAIKDYSGDETEVFSFDIGGHF